MKLNKKDNFVEEVTSETKKYTFTAIMAEESKSLVNLVNIVKSLSLFIMQNDSKRL